MSDQKPRISSPIAVAPGLSGRKLAKEILNSDAPEQVIRTVPPQSLYLAVKEQGLVSSIDLLQIATAEQRRLMMDFDCWTSDRFNEENFWEWLSLTDATDSLELLQKIFKSIDLKLVALLISRYVQIERFEESTDAPPAPGYFTPDKGATWILIKTENENHDFLMARLLALIFETDAELFYQIISIPGVATDSALEEESYNERVRRLLTEGIPDIELALEVASPLTEKIVASLLVKDKRHTAVQDIPIVQPLVYEPAYLEPLRSLIRGLKEFDEFERELSFVMNAALVRWKIPYYEPDEVSLFARKVRGAINIGLEVALRLSDLAAEDIYARLGIKQLFQAGLGRLKDLRTAALAISDEQLKRSSEDAIHWSLVARSREPFPELPEFFGDDGKIHDQQGKLTTTAKPFEKLQQIESVERELAVFKGNA